MNWIDKLERKFGRYAIPQSDVLHHHSVCGRICAELINRFYYNYLSLDAEAILHGQIWRIVTFMIQPPSSSLMFIIIVLVFYYVLGSNLERTWGAFRFNVYFFSGMLFHVIAAMALFTC